MEPVGLKTYMLVRVGMDVGKGEWFGTKLYGERPAAADREDLEDRASAEALQAPSRHPLEFLFRPLKNIRRKRLEKRPGAGHGAARGERDTGWTGHGAARGEHDAGWTGHGVARGEHDAGRTGHGAVRGGRETGCPAPDAEFGSRPGEGRVHETKAAMHTLVSRIMELADEERNCYCVYDDSVRKELVGTGEEAKVPDDRAGDYLAGVEGQKDWAGDYLAGAEGQKDWAREYLAGTRGPGDRPGEYPNGRNPKAGGEKTLACLWRECFQVAEFTGYGQLFWAKQLLPEKGPDHFVILGTAPCIYEMVEGLARRMKSLSWILLEEDYDGPCQDFVEDFYTEYGLAAAMRPVESKTALRRIRLEYVMPVNVIDFTGEARIAVTGLAEGSIWLDMMSVEEKRRRVEGQGRGIAYFSLKQKWRHAQKRCICPILP